MTESDLGSTTKLVLFVIAEYANAADDTCWPSLETIAEKASLSERAVTTHLEIAISGGWLIRWKTRRRDRRWAHCHYRLAWPDDVARRLRDDIDIGLAAVAFEPSTEGAQKVGNLHERRSGNAGELLEAGSSNAQKLSNLPEPRSNCGDELLESGSEAAEEIGNLVEPGSEVAYDLSSEGVDFESYWNVLPTNNPVVRVYETPSLSNAPPAVILGGEGTSREEDRQEPGGEMLARWMADRLLDSDPGAARPSIAEWATAVDEMRVEDGRAAKHIACLWAWALADGFWTTVVTHPSQLRKHWEKLRKRRNSSLRKAGAPVAASPAGDDRICSHVDESGQRCTHVATSILGAGSSRRGYCRQHVGIYE
ncbi:helix-turn-helix domain-containing protein [Burkholderia sp. 22PA0106]|uniref:helix-turn-helix domain-containing protein n=1 Tax=Burkholderia sp. 22PA0106 TaxID=3237371 RepID=UPI0039C0AFEE